MKAIDREKLQDCLLLIQSASNILSSIGDTVVPKIGEIRKCFDDADQRITSLLRS